MDVLTAPVGLPLLFDYPRFVFRHKIVIALLMGAGLLLGYAWSAQQPTSYSATASVVLVPVPVYVIPSTAGLLPPEVSIDTDAQLLRGPRVLAAVGDALGTGARSAEQRLSVTASPNTHVMHVTVTDTDPDRAARAADAAVAAFADARRAALGALRHDQLRQLRLFIAGQEELLAREQSRRLVIPGQDELFEEVVALRAGLAELLEARRQPAVLVRPAQPPTIADHANAEVPITSGAMLGLLGGWVVGAGRDRARQRQLLPTTSEDGHHAD